MLKGKTTTGSCPRVSSTSKTDCAFTPSISGTGRAPSQPASAGSDRGAALRQSAKSVWMSANRVWRFANSVWSWPRPPPRPIPDPVFAATEPRFRGQDPFCRGRYRFRSGGTASRCNQVATESSTKGPNCCCVRSRKNACWNCSALPSGSTHAMIARVRGNHRFSKASISSSKCCRSVLPTRCPSIQSWSPATGRALR